MPIQTKFCWSLVRTSTLCAVLTPSFAFAQADSARARALFDEGRKLASDGKYAQACPKFEDSLKLNPGIGTAYNLADCWAHTGKTASAWATFLRVASDAKNAGQTERERLARERAQSLEKQLSRLNIEAPNGVPGLEIRLDSSVIGEAGYGTAMPVDPGPHEVDATAPGRKPWHVQVDVKPEADVVNVQVPQLETATVAAKPGADAGKSALQLNPAPESQSAPAPAGTGNTQRVIGLTVVGVGAATAIAGAVSFVIHYMRKGEMSSLCPSGVCIADDQRSEADKKNSYDELNSEAGSAKLYGIVGLSLGTAVALGGALIYTSAPNPHSASVRFAPSIGENGYGLSAFGHF